MSSLDAISPAVLRRPVSGIGHGSSTWLLRLSVVATILAGAIAIASLNIVDLDIWHEMALAREIVSSGRIPTADPFAYTSTAEPFVHHEWGAGMVAYWLVTWFGPASILALKFVLFAALMALCFWCQSRRTAAEIWAFLAFPAAFFLLRLGYSPVRAQAYSYFCLAVLLWSLGRDEQGDRRWIIPFLLLFPLWANLHGGCALGIVLLGIHWLERIVNRKRDFHLLAVAAVMILLLFINPYGAEYHRYLWRALTMARPHITEWRPAWSCGPAIVIPLGLCIAVSVYTVIYALVRRAGVPFGMAIVLSTGAEAILHVKMVPVFAVAWLCYSARQVGPTPLGRVLAHFAREWKELAAATWLALVVGLMIYGVRQAHSWPLRVPGEPIAGLSSVYPVAAVDYLREQDFSGNLMTPFNCGAYVSWKLYPKVSVSLDGRYEVVFSERLLEQNLDFYDAHPGWRQTLTSYPTDAVLLRKRDPVAAVMPQSGWAQAYSDSQFEVYVRPGLRLPAVRRSGRVPDGSLP